MEVGYFEELTFLHFVFDEVLRLKRISEKLSIASLDIKLTFFCVSRMFTFFEKIRSK